MYCSICGRVPNEPVVSRLNGALYERKLIEQFVEQHGRDPVTNEPLMKDDLLPVRSGAASGAAAVGAASIPTLLAQLNNEWDALMLEQFSLRQQLSTAQQELSHALYKHDAACRVISRLVSERDTARKAAGLAIEETGGVTADALNAGDAADGGALPVEVCNEIDANAARLKAARKRREIHRDVPSETKLKEYTEVADVVPQHATTGGTPTMITCAAISELNGGKTVFTGGADGKGLVFDLHRNAVAGSLLGHTKTVRDIEAALDFVVTCSDDSTTRVWRSEVGNYRCENTLKAHSGPVSGLAILPSHRHILTAGTDGALHFQDLEAGISICNGRSNDTAVGMSAVALHPDGFMAATASAGTVQLWDVKAMNVDAGLAMPSHAGNVTAISFSENGYTMAVGGSTGVMQLWDFRNLDAPLEAIVFDDHATRGHPIEDLAFDPSGQYIAVATNNLKLWSIDGARPHSVATMESHRRGVTCVAWGSNATWLVSGGADRHVKEWRRVVQ